MVTRQVTRHLDVSHVSTLQREDYTAAGTTAYSVPDDRSFGTRIPLLN